MGLEESKIGVAKSRQPLIKSKSIARSKSSLSSSDRFEKQLIDFVSQLTSIASLNSATSNTIRNDVFNKLPFKEHKKSLPKCSKITTRNDSIFICYDCSINDRAYLCEKCFENGKHDSHNFCLFLGNNGSEQNFCRCGDPQFMKEKTICQNHKKAQKISTSIVLDKAQQDKFNSYFTETFRVLYKLMEVKRGETLNSAIFQYLKSLTNQSLYYSKMLAQFLLLANPMNEIQSNLHKYLSEKKRLDMVEYKVLRNISFLDSHKKPIIDQLIRTLNSIQSSCNLEVFIINFLGKIDILNELAKQDLFFGIGVKNLQKFYREVVNTNEQACQIWKGFARNRMAKNLIEDIQVFKSILKDLQNDKDTIKQILAQLAFTEKGQKQINQKFIIPCLISLNPGFYQIKSGQKPKAMDKQNQQLLKGYYMQILIQLKTRRRNDPGHSQMLLLLPFFNFGEQLLNMIWEQMIRRIQLADSHIAKRYETQEDCWNFLEFFQELTQTFVKWQHKTIEQANRLKIKKYFQNQKLIKKLIRERFECLSASSKTINTATFLSVIDLYTLNRREVVKDLIKDQITYNSQENGYEYKGETFANNLYNYNQLTVEQKIPLSDWHNYVGKKIFTTKVYQIVERLIQACTRVCSDNITMAQKCSNLAIFLSLMKPQEQEKFRKMILKLMRQINQNSLPRKQQMNNIRRRFSIQFVQLEEEGKQGRKRIKGNEDDQEIKMKPKPEQNKMKSSKSKNKNIIQKLCSFCEEKQEKGKRFVYPCYFTRNNVVSTLLESTVTDIDMNICPHLIHEACYDKLKEQNNNNKKECPECLFQMNCYIPLNPLPDQGFNKNWLRIFQQIITQFNLKTGRCSSTDWATIFLTFLVFSRSCKTLMKSSDLQIEQRNLIDKLIMGLFKHQMEHFPDQTRKALDKAEKTMKGQVAREPLKKKPAKSITLDLIIHQITGDHIKKQVKVLKKVPELIQGVGKGNALIILQSCQWSKDNAQVKKVFEETPGDLNPTNFFKIRSLPKDPQEFLRTTSIKCPMCNKYQPTTKQCLFCDKRFCSNCINDQVHCQNQHKGNTIYLHLNDAQFQFYFCFKAQIPKQLYLNNYRQGWRRRLPTKGWESATGQIYEFFDRILHTENPFPKDPKLAKLKKLQNKNANSGNSNFNNNNADRGGFGNPSLFQNNPFGSQPLLPNNGFGNNSQGFGNSLFGSNFNSNYFGQ